MLRKARAWISGHRTLAVVISLAVVLILVSLFFPIYGDICSKPNEASHDNCVPHHILLVWLWQAGEIANYYGGAITAIATGFIGWFTYTLKKTSLEQARLTRKAVETSNMELVAAHRA